jgi:hypothetical protein
VLHVDGDTIDLRGVAVADPALLREIEAAVAAGARYVRGVVPEVWKALHVAGVAGKLERR